MTLNSLLYTIVVTFFMGCLGGCYKLDRFLDVGDKPPLTRVQDPTAYEGYQPVRMPMPSPQEKKASPQSLWRPGARSFFRDQRAARKGDLVVIKMDLKYKAEFKSDTTAERENKMKSSVTNFLNAESRIKKYDLTKPLIDLASNPEQTSSGKTKNEDTLQLNITATVIQVLPNGNFVISGRKEVRIGFEARDILLSGIIRPEDILSDNTIDFERVAEARISYSGRGQLSDAQQTPIGHELIRQFYPF